MNNDTAKNISETSIKLTELITSFGGGCLGMILVFGVVLPIIIVFSCVTSWKFWAIVFFVLGAWWFWQNLT